MLTRFEAAGKGALRITPGGNLEHIQLNSTDPNVEVDGERSSIKTKHPTLSDPAVRQAMSLLVDKASVEKYIYGRTGAATPNFINNPARFARRTRNTSSAWTRRSRCWTQAGWKPGADGIARQGRQVG